jgi:transposase
VIEGIVCYRTGVPWRDLPDRFGPWQTAQKRHLASPPRVRGIECWLR